MVEVLGDHVVDERGRAHGLRDLAAACATEPPAAWPQVVRRHVRAAVSPAPTLADLDDATLEASCVLRLLPAAAPPTGTPPPNASPTTSSPSSRSTWATRR